MLGKECIESKIMRILITNDDGIHARGLHRLVELAKDFGEVCVFAPADKCSGLSRAITVEGVLRVKPIRMPDVRMAYSISGTPADCVRMAINCIMDEKPDLVLSGINNGFNLGRDIVYSGTIAAALEGAEAGIRSVAFSQPPDHDFETAAAFFPVIMESVLNGSCRKNMLTNVNFPDCSAGECRGIMWNSKLSSQYLYEDCCKKTAFPDGSMQLDISAVHCRIRDEESDITAVLNRYISVGPAAY